MSRFSSFLVKTRQMGIGVACLLTAYSAIAQPLPSVTLPHGDLAAGDHAEAIVVNPAGIGLVN